MSILSLIAVFVVVGLLLYLVNFLPMDPKVKQVMHIAVVIFLILWLISLFFGPLGNISLPRIG